MQFRNRIFFALLQKSFELFHVVQLQQSLLVWLGFPEDHGALHAASSSLPFDSLNPPPNFAVDPKQTDTCN